MVTLIDRYEALMKGENQYPRIPPGFSANLFTINPIHIRLESRDRERERERDREKLS